MVATVTTERGHTLGILTMSGAVLLARRRHTGACHMGAFGRGIRHVALL